VAEQEAHQQTNEALAGEKAAHELTKQALAGEHQASELTAQLTWIPKKSSPLPSTSTRPSINGEDRLDNIVRYVQLHRQ
jgi:hypothetical protein